MAAASGGLGGEPVELRLRLGPIAQLDEYERQRAMRIDPITIAADRAFVVAARVLGLVERVARGAGKECRIGIARRDRQDIVERAPGFGEARGRERIQPLAVFDGRIVLRCRSTRHFAATTAAATRCQAGGGKTAHQHDRCAYSCEMPVRHEQDPSARVLQARCLHITYCRLCRLNPCQEAKNRKTAAWKNLQYPTAALRAVAPAAPPQTPTRYRRARP